MPPTGLPQPLRNGFNPLHYMYMFHRTDRRERRAAADDRRRIRIQPERVANCGNFVEERGLRHAGARAAEETTKANFRRETSCHMARNRPFALARGRPGPKKWRGWPRSGRRNLKKWCLGTKILFS
jgi:hypothetical protein